MRVRLGMAGRQHWWSYDEGHSMHRRIAGACSRIDTALVTPPAESEDDTFLSLFFPFPCKGALGRPYTMQTII